MGRCWCSQLTLGDGKVIWWPILVPLFNEGIMWRIPIASILGISSGIYSFVDKVVFHISSKQNFWVMGLMFWGFPQWQFVDHIDEYELSNHFWQDIKNCDQILFPKKLWDGNLTILDWRIVASEVEFTRVLLEKGVEVDCSSDAGPPLSFGL
jgi:hypothetical protein